MSQLTNVLLASVLSAGIGVGSGVALSAQSKADLYPKLSAAQHGKSLCLEAREDLLPDGTPTVVWETNATYVVPSLVAGLPGERITYRAPTYLWAVPQILALVDQTVTASAAAKAGIHSSVPFPDGGTP